MSAPAKAKVKEPVDIVHQNAIHVETILKEQRNQKLYTNFSINPFKKLHVLTDKPMSRTAHHQAEGDRISSGLLLAVSELRDDLDPSLCSSYDALPNKISSISSAFIKIIRGACLEPTKKYTYPMTESQEIGWISRPLIASDRADRRLNFPRQNSEITKYMDAAWRLKEQTQNLG